MIQELKMNRVILRPNEGHHLDFHVFQSFHDVQLVSSEGTILGINRSVLACQSPVFERLFSAQDISTEEPQFVITEINQRDLEFYVHFVTTGTIPCETLDHRTLQNFYHLGIDLTKLCLNTAPFIKSEKPTLKISHSHKVKSKSESNVSSAKVKHNTTDNYSKIEDEYSMDYEGVKVKVEVKDGNNSDCEYFPEYSEEFDQDENAPLTKKRKRKRNSGVRINKRSKGVLKEGNQRLETFHVKGLFDDYGNPVTEVAADFFHFPTTGQVEDDKIQFPYSCHLCIRAFKYQSQLTQHLYRHESKTQTLADAWSCDLCDGNAKFSSPMELIDHKCQAHEGYEKCDRCLGLIDLKGKKKRGKNGQSIKRVKEHRKCVRECLYCVSCGLWNVSVTDKSKHIETKGGPEFHGNNCAYTEECPGVTFESWTEHLYHIQSVHGGVQKLKCKFCTQSFFSEDEQRHHLRMVHAWTPGVRNTKAKKAVETSQNVCDSQERDFSKPFQCSKCVAGFNTKGQLNAHLVEHDWQDGFDSSSGLKCPFCQDEFPSLEELSKHKALRHYVQDPETKMWKCLECDNQLTNYKHMEWHIRRQHVIGMKECVTCGERFDKKDLVGFKRHLIEVHGKVKGGYGSKPRNKCPSCPGVIFYTYKDRVDHADKFHGGKILSACSHCKEVFDDEAEKKKHELEAHPDTETDGFWSEKKKIPCEFCGKVVMQKCMKAHIRMVHGEDQYACDKCPLVYKCKKQLEQHVKGWHTYITCEVCGESVKAGNLKSHKSLLHDPKVKCDQCDEMVPAKKMWKHVRAKHTSEEALPFKCSFCPKGFITGRRLEDHENVHKGIKPYKCKECDASYACNANLCAHVRSVHRGIKRK